MDALHFAPLWSSPPMIESKIEIEQVRVRVLEWALDFQDESDPFPTFVRALDALFENPEENVLQYLEIRGGVRFIEEMLRRWFVSAAPVLGTEIQAGNALRNANLGFLAMLLTANNWTVPAHPCLYSAALTANVVASMVFAAYSIARADELDTGNAANGSNIPFRTVVATFAKCACQLARGGSRDMGGGPEEIRLSRHGKGILIRADREEDQQDQQEEEEEEEGDGKELWLEPPFWHPLKQVPGSPWNKFLKNKQQPIFPSTDEDVTAITHRMPSSAMDIISPFQRYYRELRFRFDRDKRPRAIIRRETRPKQFAELASESGMWYPDAEIHEGVSDEAYDVFPRFQCKRPASDSKGHATLALLTSAARAMRFEEEPEVNALFMMLFGGHEGGEFY